ncbi:MAG: ATP-dependent DNA helicase [Myxococcota bacterium]
MNVAQVASFFDAEGPLAGALGTYERRNEQIEIARAVTEAINQRRSLIAEAGTGTGKTLAYLVPAIASGLRVVVSTATRNLQDQLFEKDVPDLMAAAGVEIPVEVMKGRTNYVCLTRAELKTAQGNLVEGGELDAFRAWVANTHIGDLSELSSLPEDGEGFRRDVTATSEQCTGRRCRLYEKCFVTQMRRRAQTATLLLVNHHLYFADAALRTRATDSSIRLLPPHDLVVFDEAHEIDEIAAQHFGYHVGEARMNELLRDVGALSDERLDRGAARGLVVKIDRETRKLFDVMPFRDGPMRLDPKTLGRGIREQQTEVDALLGELEACLDDAGSDESLQLARRAATIAAELAFILREPVRQSTVGEITLDDAKVLDTNPPYRDEGVAPPQVERPERFDLPFVHYSERRNRQRAIVARPIDVAPLMMRHVRDVPAIYVSATLAVDDKRSQGPFGHFRARLGIDDANEIRVGSPFDYPNSVRLYLPQDLPPPDDPAFTRATVERTRELILASGGGAFVLCTSYRMVQAMRESIRRLDRLVLCQGDAPRGRLVEAFRDHGDAVLIGTMSLWRGVDVAGEALRLVVIDKLPFGSPADPMHQARIELYRARGLEPFRSYQIPHAALMLRQGFGRLLRRQDDRGVVAILDTRLSARGYGKVFLRSLPECPQITTLNEVKLFYESIYTRTDA